MKGRFVCVTGSKRPPFYFLRHLFPWLPKLDPVTKAKVTPIIEHSSPPPFQRSILRQCASDPAPGPSPAAPAMVATATATAARAGAAAGAPTSDRALKLQATLRHMHTARLEEDDVTAKRRRQVPSPAPHSGDLRIRMPPGCGIPGSRDVAKRESVEHTSH